MRARACGRARAHLAQRVHSRALMSPHIDVKFARMPHDPSVEASVQRWVDRLGWANVEILRASVSIERSGWRRTSACLTLVLVGGRALTAATLQADVYVAVAEVFRAVRRQLLARAATASKRALAATG
jgi:ribosome-associated translation inhibitor RaiA